MELGLYLEDAKQIFNEIYTKYIDLLKLFCSNINKNSKFFEPVSFFPEGKDFQKLEILYCPKENFRVNAEGFCVVWSFWYAENRLKYPNKPREKIISDMIYLFETGKDKNIICKVIRGYTIFLQNLDKDESFYKRYSLYYHLHRDYGISGILLDWLLS